MLSFAALIPMEGGCLFGTIHIAELSKIRTSLPTELLKQRNQLSDRKKHDEYN